MKTTDKFAGILVVTSILITACRDSNAHLPSVGGRTEEQESVFKQFCTTLARSVHFDASRATVLADSKTDSSFPKAQRTVRSARTLYSSYAGGSVTWQEVLIQIPRLDTLNSVESLSIESDSLLRIVGLRRSMPYEEIENIFDKPQAFTKASIDTLLVIYRPLSEFPAVQVTFAFRGMRLVRVDAVLH